MTRSSFGFLVGPVVLLSLDSFMKLWLRYHPKFKNNPLYICGVSYSGVTIPSIVQKIYTGNEDDHETPINIKGYVLGNPVTDRTYENISKIEYAHRMALISDELYKSTRKNCLGDYVAKGSGNSFCQNDMKALDKDDVVVNTDVAVNRDWDRMSWQLTKAEERRRVGCNVDCAGLFGRVPGFIWQGTYSGFGPADDDIRCPPCLSKINIQHILEPVCNGEDTSNSELEDNPISMGTWCRDDNYVFLSMWAKDKTVQKALQIRESETRSKLSKL
ncbi:hypothetical protein LguiA_008712 [Lonicera macranthoides]